MDLLKWWGIVGVLHSRCENFCVQWDGLIIDRKKKKLWKLILGCTIWSLWYTRNKAKFDLIPPDPREVTYSLKTRFFLWSKEMLNHGSLSTLQRNEDLLLL